MSVAERLAKHPRWEWRAGMRHEAVEWMDPGEVVAALDADGLLGLGGDWHARDGLAPDLTDDGTAGILHAMLCEAWTRGGVDTSSNADGHEVSLYVARIRTGHDGARHRFLRRECLGEALGAALLWAWSL